MLAIVISEVSLIKDYVALENNSNNAINLRNWRIVDTTPTNQKRHEFIFKKDFWLVPDAEVKIWSGVGKDDAENIYQNRRAPIWNNLGDTAELYDANGDLVDSKTVGKPPNKGGRGPSPPKPSKIKISGFVNDSICGQGVKAHLIFESLKAQETIETDSDEAGHYKTELTVGRDYTVTVSAKNYDDFPDMVNTKAGKDMTKDFKLIPNLEISLGVDSTEVKFTRKDDNKINVTEELKNKIVVDINTDYVFTIRISVKKGMTNSVSAALKEGKKSVQTLSDNICRIDETKNQIIFLFDPIKYNKPDWHREDWLGSHINWKEKTLNYSVGLAGIYGNNQFGPKDVLSGKIIIKVTSDKLNAQTMYNIVYFATLAIAIIAIIAACIAFPPLAAAIGISAATAASIGAAAAVFGGLSALLAFATQFAVSAMNDPPKFDKQYKRILKINVFKLKKSRPMVAELKNFVLIKNALMAGRDRLYSAQLKSDKSAINLQKKNLNYLLKVNAKNTRTLLMSVSKLKQMSKKFKINKTHVKRIQQLIKSKKIPMKILHKTLKKFGFISTQTKSLLKALALKNTSATALIPFLAYARMGESLKKMDRSFILNIKKEISWQKD